jgi:hypothetical protein
MTGQGCSHGWAWEGISPTTWEPGLANQNVFGFFSTRILLQTEMLLNFISCLCDWSQRIPQVKRPDVEILGWPAYTWSAIVRPFGCTAKFSKMMLEAVYGRDINIQLSGNSSGGFSCSQHTSVALLCDKTAHFRRFLLSPAQGAPV